MFSKFKRENEIEEQSELDAFKERELHKLVARYESLPTHHVKARNGLLQSILLLEGKVEQVEGVNTVEILQEIKDELVGINKKLGELLEK